MEMKKYVIKLNGKTFEVEMGEMSGAGTVYTPAAPVSGASPAAASQTSAPAAASYAPAAPASANTIISPMPGNVLDIRVKVGDVVKKNQVVLVLEAMKMENEIVAPEDGTILSITTAKGAVVNANEALVHIG